MDEIDSHPSISSSEDLLEVYQGGEKTWRVFLGGLLDAHSDADVSALFASFGITVLSVDRMGPYKERVFYRRNKRVRARYERRISFLTCRAAGENDGPLHKALRSLHGTRWKGTTLRCQLAKSSGLDRVREEIEMDSKLKGREALDDVEPIMPMYQGDLEHGGNTVHFEDEDEDSGELEESLWDSIETPKQAVYNYEKHLEMCNALAREQHGDEPKTEEKGVSVVEAFLQAQDAARLKRREERRQASFASYLAKEKREEEGDSLAVVDFASDDDNHAKHVEAFDLSRFDDSDDDIIPQVDGVHDDSSNSSSSSSSSSGTSSSSSGEDDSDDASSSPSSASHDSSSESDKRISEDELSDGDLAAELFPGGASFHAKNDASQAQEQAKLGAHSERIQASLKQYRKRARRISMSGPSF
jgi:hypothetical protein